VFKFEFHKKAEKEIDKLASKIRKRVLEKLKFYAGQRNPLKFADRLKDDRFGEYRFRIGDYRVLFDVKNKVVIILKVGHRKDIYKG